MSAKESPCAERVPNEWQVRVRVVEGFILYTAIL